MERQKTSGGDGGGPEIDMAVLQDRLSFQILSHSSCPHLIPFIVTHSTALCPHTHSLSSILFSLYTVSLYSIVYSANRLKIMIGPARAISVAQ